MAKSSRAKWIPNIFDVVEGFVGKGYGDQAPVGVVVWPRNGWIAGRVQSREFERNRLVRIGIRLSTGHVIEVSRWRKVKAKGETSS